MGKWISGVSTKSGLNWHSNSLLDVSIIRRNLRTALESVLFGLIRNGVRSGTNSSFNVIWQNEAKDKTDKYFELFIIF